MKLPDGSVDYMYAQPAKPLASGPREAAAMKKQAKIDAAAAKAAAAAEAAGNDEDEDEAATSGLSQRAKAKLMKAKAAGEEKKEQSKQRAENEMDAGDDEEGWGSPVDDDDGEEEEADEARSRAETMQTQQEGAQAAAAEEASDPIELQEALRARVEAQKVSIATLCEAVLEAPEEHLAPSRAHPKGWSTLTQLFDVAKNDPDATVNTKDTRHANRTKLKLKTGSFGLVDLNHKGWCFSFPSKRFLLLTFFL